MTKRVLYPPIEPYRSGLLPVSELHSLYWEESGNPQGKPIVFLHGGPGGGTNPSQRSFFDPAVYRIILFDQRGCGKSTPYANLVDNTTWHLVDDIEKLREHLKVKEWIVFGGSWGSTLALAYAQTFPGRVKGLILRGIFLCRPDEISWFYQDGAHHIAPDHWEKYLSPIPPAERGSLLNAYYKRLTGSDEKVRLEAAKCWSGWEGANMRLIYDPMLYDSFLSPQVVEAHARIECHYFYHNSFFPTDNYLLENIDKIRHIPGVIVHGRYDLVCPLRSGWDLHKAWPEATLHIIPDAGHSASEPGTTDALIRATDAFR